MCVCVGVWCVACFLGSDLFRGASRAVRERESSRAARGDGRGALQADFGGDQGEELRV